MIKSGRIYFTDFERFFVKNGGTQTRKSEGLLKKSQIGHGPGLKKDFEGGQ